MGKGPKNIYEDLKLTFSRHVVVVESQDDVDVAEAT